MCIHLALIWILQQAIVGWRELRKEPLHVAQPAKIAEYDGVSSKCLVGFHEQISEAIGSAHSQRPDMVEFRHGEGRLFDSLAIRGSAFTFPIGQRPNSVNDSNPAALRGELRQEKGRC